MPLAVSDAVSVKGASSLKDSSSKSQTTQDHFDHRGKSLLWVPQLNAHTKREKSGPMLPLYSILTYLVLAH